MITYNQIVAVIQNISNAHLQVHSFGVGELDEVEGSTEADKIYPKVWLAPQTSIVQENTVTNTFNLLCFDLVKKDISVNENEVLSDTQLILYDIIKVLKYAAGDDFNIVGDVTLTPFTEKFGDFVTGWNATITIEIDFEPNACDLPIDAFMIPQGTCSSCGGTYEWLTCSTLDQCITFSSLEARVTVLENNPSASSIATLTDVTLTSLTNLDILQYDNITGMWVNIPLPSSISGLTTNYITIATSPTTIGNSYLFQDAFGLILTDGYKFESQNHKVQIDLGSGSYMNLVHINGVAQGSVFIMDTLTQISNTTTVEINTPVLKINQLSGSGTEMVTVTSTGVIGRQAIPSGLAINPTSTFMPYNNAGVLADSWLSQDVNRIFIADGKYLTSINEFSTLDFGSGAYSQLVYNNGNGLGHLYINDSYGEIYHYQKIKLYSPIVNITALTGSVTDMVTITAAGDLGRATIPSLAGYATESWVNLQGFLTGITSLQVTTALGYTPYDATNPTGYITSAALAGYELLTNKATDFTTVNNTLYPTVQATNNAINTAIGNIMSGANTFMFYNSASDIGGYLQLKSLPTYTAGGLATVTTNVGTSATLMSTFATTSGQPNITVIPIGIFTVHYETKKASGANNYYTYAKIYKRNLAGTETLIGTTDNTTQTAINTVIDNSITCVIPTPIVLLTTDRIVVKVYGVMLSASANIDLLFDDTTNARIEFPFAPTSLATLIDTKSITFDGQGVVIQNNTSGMIEIEYTGTIIGWTLVECSGAPVTTTCTLDTWKSNYASYPPVVGGTIFGTKPALAAAIKNQSGVLAISVTAGDFLKVNLDSNVGGLKLKLIYHIQRA